MKEVAPLWLTCVVLFGQMMFVIICIYLGTDGFGTSFWRKLLGGRV